MKPALQSGRVRTGCLRGHFARSLFIFSLGLLPMFVTGCLSPENLAKRLMTPPNQQHRLSPEQTEQWTAYLTGGKDLFNQFTVPVGPPNAQLEVLELPPGDYNLEPRSQLLKQKHGDKEFVFSMVARTNIAETAVAERGNIVLLHGYATQKETMIPWALLLAKSGYRVWLVDLRGHGNSTGDVFSGGKYEAADMQQLLDYIVTLRGGDGKVGVLGISFGADLGLLWAARDPRVRTVVAIAPYDQPDLAFERFVKAMHLPVPTRSLQQALELAAEQLEINWADYSGMNAVQRIAEPLLLVGAGKDTISPPDEVKALEAAAPAGSALVMIPEANHFVVGYWFHDLGEPVTAWFQSHLPVIAASPLDNGQSH